MKLWKEMVVIIFLLSLICSPCGAEWKETVVVPAEYEKIQYEQLRDFYLLYNDKTKAPNQYFKIDDKIRDFPEGMEFLDKYASISQKNRDEKLSFKEPILMVREKGNGEKIGIIDFEGKILQPLVKESWFSSYYSDGYASGSEGIYKGRNLIFPNNEGRVWRILGKNQEKRLFIYAQSNKIVNDRKEIVLEIPYTDKMRAGWGELFIGKSNGKDGKPEAYRIWNWEKKEVTPRKEGFLELIFLREEKAYTGKSPFGKAILGRTEKGWEYYSYLGKGKFGTPIFIGSDMVHDVGLAFQLSPYYYAISPNSGGSLILDMEKCQLYPKEYDWACYINKERLTKYGYAKEGNYYQIFDQNEKLIFELKGKMSIGKEVIIYLNGGATQFYNYEGTILREFKSSREGYLPIVGKNGSSGELDEDQRSDFHLISKKYQPFYFSGSWGVMDRDTGQDVVKPDARYNSIITVSEDGKRFWSLFGEGEGKERRYGIKQFEWVE